MSLKTLVEVNQAIFACPLDCGIKYLAPLDVTVAILLIDCYSILLSTSFHF